MRLLKKIRVNSIYSRRNINYLKYAIGEIILIVIGLLIAVSIDTQNNKRIQNKALNSILLKMEKDFQEDLKEIKKIETHYSERELSFDSIMNQKYTKESLKSCRECHFLISGHILFKPNKEGFTSLQNFMKLSENPNNNLVSFVQRYSILLEELNLMKSNIIEDVNGNLIEWRDNYEWFTPFFKGENNEDYINYRIENIKYRNKVTYHYALVYNNYLPVIDKFKHLFLDFDSMKANKSYVQ